MEPVDVPKRHGLTQRLQYALVPCGNPPGVSTTDGRFSYVVGPERLICPEVHRPSYKPARISAPVKLRTGNSYDLATGSQDAATGDGVSLNFDVARQALIRDNALLRKRIIELEKLGATDLLTGAGNRAQLQRMVDMEISRTTRTGQSVTLVLLDIDHFKRINDAHGHLAGDTILTEFVGRIRKRVRHSDSVFRWAGDEFAVLATSVGYRGGAALAEALRRSIGGAPFAEFGLITASLGVTEYMAGETANEWFRRTDQALYAAKSAGRNRMHVDRRGISDLRASHAGTRARRLYWLDAYECGDPVIDSEHRQLFGLGNALIAAAIAQNSEPGSWRSVANSMLAHLVQHFQDEEALLGRHRDRRLAEHQSAHSSLLRRMAMLMVAVERNAVALSRLVNFVVNDVIALHVLQVDRDFDLPGRSGNDGWADRAPAV